MLSDEMRQALKQIADLYKPPELPWTQNGTRVAVVAERLARLDLLTSIGKSATGTYWAVTVEGYRALKRGT